MLGITGIKCFIFCGTIPQGAEKEIHICDLEAIGAKLDYNNGEITYSIPSLPTTVFAKTKKPQHFIAVIVNQDDGNDHFYYSRISIKAKKEIQQLWHDFVKDYPSYLNLIKNLTYKRRQLHGNHLPIEELDETHLSAILSGADFTESGVITLLFHLIFLAKSTH